MSKHNNREFCDSSYNFLICKRRPYKVRHARVVPGGAGIAPRKDQEAMNMMAQQIIMAGTIRIILIFLAASSLLKGVSEWW